MKTARYDLAQNRWLTEGDKDSLAPDRYNEIKSPEELAHSKITEFVLHDIEQEFGFNANSAENAQAIRHIAGGYILGCRLQADADYKATARREYEQAQAAVRKLVQEMLHWRKSDIPYHMEIAVRLQAVKNKDDTSQQPDQISPSGSSPFEEALRLLNLLGESLDSPIKRFSPERGRSTNLGLETAVRRCAEFWEDTLKLPFTVDYHAGSGLTHSFHFLKKLLFNLDKLEDKKIVTAMRNEIRSRNISKNKLNCKREK